jgi:hypothetical protein
MQFLVHRQRHPDHLSLRPYEMLVASGGMRACLYRQQSVVTRDAMIAIVARGSSTQSFDRCRNVLHTGGKR